MQIHNSDECPLMHASYCGLCSSYGHSPSICPDTLTQAYREPLYVEQLIPTNLLEEYGIYTQTMLKNGSNKLVEAKKSERTMVVPETDEALRAALVALGVKPMICQEKGKRENKEIIENKKRLQRVADMNGKKLIFIPNL